jgi:CitB family two-component system sensor histidine kinase MalK
MSVKKPLLNLQTKIAILVCGVVALALLVTNTLVTRHIAATVEASIAEKAADIARVVARSPLVIASLDGGQNAPDIRSFASEIRKATNVEFVVVMDMNGIRKSHPNPALIGRHFVGGDEEAVLREVANTLRSPRGRSAYRCALSPRSWRPTAGKSAPCRSASSSTTWSARSPALIRLSTSPSALACSWA